MESGVPAVKPSLLYQIFLWVETGEPGVKPPEPVIDVWRHQCLQEKKREAISYQFVHGVIRITIISWGLRKSGGK